ncbi:hypothetical protein AB9P05_17330 [Roseivirga sp. BDSF3-8]|uniref:hypothetical protein n=1 Tax=Roseivirga sp. BDSF3-8 TaxID=3241598 RepID=UPI0035321FD5
MDLYTTNGNIIRKQELDKGLAEIEIEFVGVGIFWTRLFCMVIYYLVLHHKHKVAYVHSNHTMTRVVINQSDYNDGLREDLIQALLLVREESNLVKARADELLLDREDLKVVETNTAPALDAYKKTSLEGQAFLEAVAAELG